MSTSPLVALGLAVALAAPPAPSIDRDPEAPTEPMSAEPSATSEAVDPSAVDPTEVAPAPAAPVEGPARADGPAPIYVGCGAMVPACERLTIVGTVAGGVGLAAVLTATGLMLNPDRVIADEPSSLRSTKEAGTTLFAVGAGLIVTSVLMILTATRATNRERQRRRRVVARLGGAR